MCREQKNIRDILIYSLLLVPSAWVFFRLQEMHIDSILSSYCQWFPFSTVETTTKENHFGNYSTDNDSSIQFTNTIWVFLVSFSNTQWGWEREWESVCQWRTNIFPPPFFHWATSESTVDRIHSNVLWKAMKIKWKIRWKYNRKKN